MVHILKVKTPKRHTFPHQVTNSSLDSTESSWNYCFLGSEVQETSLEEMFEELLFGILHYFLFNSFLGDYQVLFFFANYQIVSLFYFIVVFTAEFVCL